MTLVFLLLVGVVSIIFLWSISIVTGAYNTLYIANQNAAIAAASTASTEASDGAGNQAVFQCDPTVAQELSGASTACSLPTASAAGAALAEIEGAPAVFAARAVMRDSLANEPFGLRFVNSPQGAKNVQLIPEPWVASFASGREYVMRFNVPLTSGDIQSRLANGASCIIPSDRYYGTLSDELLPPGGRAIHCWQIKERGVNFARQFNSGVITRARAQLQIFGNCPVPGVSVPLICGTQEITVSAAATLKQLRGREDWEDFYYLTP
jgi:hypothetical protein